MKRRLSLFALAVLFCVTAAGGFVGLPGEEHADALTVRVTAASDSAAVSFDVLFRTEADTLVARKAVATPWTFEVEAAQFRGHVRPLGGQWSRCRRCTAEYERAGPPAARSL